METNLWLINDSIDLWTKTTNLSGTYSILHFQTFSLFLSKSWILGVWHSFPTFLFFFVQKRLFTKEIAKLGETNLTTNPSCKNLLIFLSTKKWNWNGSFFVVWYFCIPNHRWNGVWTNNNIERVKHNRYLQ